MDLELFCSVWIMTSGLLFSVLSAISSLVSLSVILLCIWIVSRGSRGNTNENVTADKLFNIPKVRPRGEITIWIGSMLMMLAVGLATGYGFRNHELVSNTRMYFDVSVVSQQSDREYIVHIPDYSRDWDWKFCHPLKMPGPRIDIKYEQRYGCKAVNGVGFVSIHQQEKGNVELQTRRDSTPATTAASF